MPEAVKDFLAGVTSILDFTDSANRDLDVVRSERDGFRINRERLGNGQRRLVAGYRLSC